MSSGKAALVLVGFALALPAAAAEDLRALEVQGRLGQSQEQARRDRYECHNWAIEQTGESPPALSVDHPRDDARDVRRERIDRAIIGAAIGGAVGSILGNGRRRDSSDRVLAGAAAGAAIGAAKAGERGSRREATEPAPPSDYLRALTACLEGRGYSVSLPTTATLAANR